MWIVAFLYSLGMMDYEAFQKDAGKVLMYLVIALVTGLNAYLEWRENGCHS